MAYRDSSYTYIHLKSSTLVDLFEDLSRPSLPTSEPILIPPHLQPPNPEDEDDVVPDQHAAFGIQRATQPRREPAWRDLGLEDLMAGDIEADSALGSSAGGASGTSAQNHSHSQSQAVAGANTAQTEGTRINALARMAMNASQPRSGQPRLLARSGRGRGAGWTREGDIATGVGVRTLPR